MILALNFIEGIKNPYIKNKLKILQNFKPTRHF